MEKFLGIVIIIVISFIVLKWLARLFLPIILKKLFQKLTNNTFGQTFNFSSQQEPENKPEGEVFVTGNGKKNTNNKHTDEEYIDFEEVK